MIIEKTATATPTSICPESLNKPCFVPTPNELALLVNHWATEAINHRYFIFFGQCFGSSDIRFIDSCSKRVDEIAEVLGDEATDAAVEYAYQQAAKNFDRNHWIVFRYGTREEKDAYQKLGGQCFEEFKDGVAEKMASQVMARRQTHPAEMRRKI